MSLGTRLKNYTKPPIDTEDKHYWSWLDRDGWVSESLHNGKIVYTWTPRLIPFLRNGKWDANVEGE